MVHVTDLYRAARRLVEQDSDAEDLVQETCLRAFRCLDQLRQPRAAKLWVFSILRSVYARQRERGPKGAEVSLDDIDASRLSSVQVLQDAYERLSPAAHALREEIRRAVLKLPLPYREAVVLAHIGGFSYREIATILHLPLGTVMSGLFRGRRLLRASLREVRPQPELG
jgi:RNA polymerase sigma-70 factor (ECF subfamily)